jgi:hypothetical protein
MNGADRKPGRDGAFPSVQRWALSPSATAFLRDRAETLKTDPATLLEDLVLVERRRVEGSL